MPAFLLAVVMSDFIGTGLNNAINAQVHSAIVSGSYNVVNGDYSFIGSGGGATAATGNIVNGNFSLIVGGYNNTVTSNYAGILGGANNTIPGGFNNTFIAGSNIVLGGVNGYPGALHVNSLWAGNIPTVPVAANVGTVVGVPVGTPPPVGARALWIL